MEDVICPNCGLEVHELQCEDGKCSFCKDIILINPITPPVVDIYRNDEYFATVNEYEFNDLRIQIKNLKPVDVYSVWYNGEKSIISNNGRLNGWPIGLFNLMSNQLDILTDF